MINQTHMATTFGTRRLACDVVRRCLLLPALLALLVTVQAAVLVVWSAPVQAQADAVPEEEESKPLGKHIFIKMAPLISPVLDDRSIRGKITLRLKLYLLNPALEEKVRHRTPQLSDAFLNYMYRYGSSAASISVMQLASVLATLQRLADKVLGEGVVTVLIEEVSRSRAN